MGCVDTISFSSFPKQHKTLHARVKVCFHYDTSHMIGGTIVREDAEEPYDMIIRLDDGRYVRGVECQYSHERIQDLQEGGWK